MFLNQQYVLYACARRVQVKPYKYISYLRSYLLTPSSRLILEKLTGFQLVKKFTAYYGNRKLITAFASARHVQGYSIRIP